MSRSASIIHRAVWLTVAVLLLAMLWWSCTVRASMLDPADTIIAATAELRGQRDDALATVNGQAGQIADLAAQLQDVTATAEQLTRDKQDLLAKIDDLTAQLAALEDGSGQPPAAASSIRAATDNPTVYVAGDGTSLRFSLDGSLRADDTVVVSAWNKAAASIVAGWTHTIGTEPIIVPAEKLDALPTGKIVVTAALVRAGSELSKASILLTIKAGDADPGTRTDVYNLVPAAGTTYRNLIIHGGVNVVWRSVDDVTFINCDFRDATTHVTVQAQDDGSGACSNWTFKNCTFKFAKRSDWGHTHGCFLKGVKNFTFEDCVWEHNGWIGTTRFNQNHNVYLDSRRDADHPTWAINENIRFIRCQFIEAAAQGVKMRGFTKLTFDNCTFKGNLIDLANDTRSPGGELIIKNCTFINTGGTDSINLTYGWSIHLKSPSENPLQSATISNCKWIGPGVSDGPGWSGTIGILLQEAGVKSVLIENPDFSQWHGETEIKNQIGDRLKVIGTNP